MVLLGSLYLLLLLILNVGILGLAIMLMLTYVLGWAPLTVLNIAIAGVTALLLGVRPTFKRPAGAGPLPVEDNATPAPIATVRQPAIQSTPVAPSARRASSPM